jgi:preprotein translocase subunit Sss1
MDRKAAILMSMGFEIVGVVFFAIFVGRWLDGKYNLNGLATAGLIAVGFVGWLVHVILIAKQLQSPEAAPPESPKSDQGQS